VSNFSLKKTKMTNGSMDKLADNKNLEKVD
jgi:hypothetical protein